MILLVDCPHEEKSWGGRVLTWGTEGGGGARKGGRSDVDDLGQVDVDEGKVRSGKLIARD